MTNLRLFQTDRVFEFDTNGREFSKRVENTVGKGEIAHYEQFLLFQQCFQRFVHQTHKNQGLFRKGLNVVKIMVPVFYRVENIVRKGENAGHQHFLLSYRMFLKGFLQCMVLNQDHTTFCAVRS